MASGRSDTHAVASVAQGHGGAAAGGGNGQQSSKGFPGMQVKGEMSGGGNGRPDAAERLSALLDGELSARELDELLSEMDASPALEQRLGQQWSRMSAVQAAREGVRFNAVSVDFAAGVMAALDEAPAPVHEVSASRVVDLNAVRAARAPRRNLWRPAYGLAAAASIAAVAVLTAVGNHKNDGAPAAVAVANNPVVSVQRGFTPVVLNAAGIAQPVQETGWSQLDPESARLFDDYVIEHSNYRVAPGMTGSLSYARFAAYGADARSANGSR